MAVGTAAMIGGALAGGALLGGASGAMSKKTSQKNTSGVNLNPYAKGGFEEQFYGGQTPNLGPKQQEELTRWQNILGDPSASAKDKEYANSQINDLKANPANGFTAEQGVQGKAFNDLQGMVNAGPNQGDYTKGVQSQRDLAAMFGDYAKTGGLPSQDDINSSNGIADNLYASRQTALNQSFTDQNTEAERLAARLGRPVNDSILQAKLRTGFIRQQDLLNSEKMGTSQNLALQLPGQRLGYAQQQAGLLDALGQQAMSNRNFLLGLGSQIGGQERDWRFRTSQQYNNATSSGGGGLGGAISGAIGGAGAGMSAFGAYQSGQASQGLISAQTNYLNRLAPMSLPTTAPTNPFAGGQTQFAGAGNYNLGNFRFS